MVALDKTVQYEFVSTCRTTYLSPSACGKLTLTPLALARLADLERVSRWQNKAKLGYVEDIEDIKDYDKVKVKEVEEVKEPGEDSDSDVEEIESWNWKRAVSEEI